MVYDGSEPGGGVEAPAAVAPPASTSFTQEQVTAIAAREKEEGRRAAERALVDQLGLPLADVKRLITEASERDAAQQSEAQKAQKRAEAAEREAAEREAAAMSKAHEAEVRLALLEAGVPKDRLAVVARIVDAPLGADAEVLAASVAAARASLPEAFGQAPPVPPVASDPVGAAPAQPRGGEGAYERGAARAKEWSGRSSTGYQLLQDN